MALQKISVGSLKVGMYVAGFDRPWIETPFLQEFLIRSESDIEKLKRCGVKMADVDPARGSAGPPPAPAPPAAATAFKLAAPAEPAMTFRIKESAPPLRMQAPARPAAGALTAVQTAKQEFTFAIHNALSKVRDHGTVDDQQVQQIAGGILDKVSQHPSAFTALIKTREFDPTLCDHLFSVCTLAICVGHSLGYKGVAAQSLATGALLHDIGLHRLPHHLVRLSQRLSKPEQALYDSHARLGSELLEKTGGFHPDVVRIVTLHHAETGPAATPGAPPPVERIVSLVDRYDELISGQHGGGSLPTQQALSHLYQQSHGHPVDAPIVSHLIRAVGIYPLYSVVGLSSGEVGVVTSVHLRLHQPVVTLVKDAHGNAYQPPRVLDLVKETQESSPRTIVKVLDAAKEGIHVEDFFNQPEPAIPSTP
jgi:putative nucleotidyltransferase with HDIG domain